MTLDEDKAEMLRLSGLIDAGVEALREQARRLADSELAYRKGKASAWVRCPEGTVSAREAWVGGETADLRHARDLADHGRVAALEALRSRRQQLSAFQSYLAADRAEAEFIRTSGGMRP